MYYFQLNATSSDTDADTSQTSPLYEALDRFSQFFIEPLFLEDCLVRELKAVDSEHKKNLQSDVWRAQQLDRTLSNHAHPRRLFSTGSYKTLHDDPIARGVSIRESFIKFYQQHYSANNMKLVVLGRESLDQLQEWCSTLFAPVVNRQFPRPHWTMAPYGKDECMTQVFTKTIKDEKSLVLKFSIPDQTELWQYRPDSYISGLIGDEGPGSILAVLKSHGWATSLSAGASGATADEPTFGIHVSLTPEGFKEYRGVTKLVFQYIAILSSQAPEEWRHDETRKLREIDFKFSEKQRADQTTSTLAAVMHEPYQRECLLSAGSVATKFNAQYVKDILACLHPSQLRLVLSAQQLPVEPDKTEEWYGTEYRYEPIPKDYIQELTRSFDDSIAGKRPSELQLPKRNEFIPDNLSVEKHKVDKPALAPTLLRSDDSVRIWWKKDDTFWAPKADLHIKLRSVLVGASALTVTLAMLFQMLVEDSLQEHAYAAEIAGLEYAVSATTDGFSIQLAGYNDKLAVLLERVLVAIRDLTFTDNRFEVIKDRISRSLANAEYQEPYRQIMTRLNWLITERTYLHHEQLAELSRIGPDDVRHASREMLKQLHIEVFAFGNLQRKEALHCSELVENILKPRSLPTTQWRVRRQIMLATGKQYEFASTLKDPANINHCLVYSVNCGPHTDLETRNKALLFDTMTSTSCFETLRTKEQLGYVVHSTARLFTTEWSFFILVQSERDPVYLESRVVAWLDGLEKYLDEMSDAQFESFRGGLVKSRLQKLKNMAEESARLWARVSRESYEFDRGLFLLFSSLPASLLLLSLFLPAVRRLLSPQSQFRVDGLCWYRVAAVESGHDLSRRQILLFLQLRLRLGL